MFLEVLLVKVKFPFASVVVVSVEPINFTVALESAVTVDASYQTANRQRLSTKDYFLEFKL